MIHGVVESLLEVLREALADAVTDVDEQVLAGPASPPTVDTLPLIVLSPGRLELESRVKDEATGQPRPRPAREAIHVNGGQPAGPYSLAQPPLEDSLRCQVIFETDTRRERSLDLGVDDFDLDPAAPSITFARDLTGADKIRLSYSYAAIFALREFNQDLYIDVYDTTPAGVERHGSLLAGILLTGQVELLDDANRIMPTSYELGRHTTRHVFDRLALLGGEPLDVSSGAILHQRLRIRVTGRLEATRALEQPAARIEHVRSPGQISEHPVDIEPDVDA